MGTFILSYGGTRLNYPGIGAVKYRYTPPFVSTLPYLIFEFSNTSFNPSTISTYGTWTKIDDGIYAWECQWYDRGTTGFGWAWAFSTQDSTPIGRLTPQKLGGTCRIIEAGNLDWVDPDNSSCKLTTMDRLFANCTAITSCVLLNTPSYLENVGGTFGGCVNIDGGALAQYNYWNTYGTSINNHSGTFTDCGADTQTGSDELDQIPTGWGGRLVPASTTLQGTRNRITSNYDSWVMGDTAPTWSNVSSGMYLFTTVSVSSYAGVSMNRSRIKSYRSLATTTGNPLYFYPCFFQGNSMLDWLVTTGYPNGALAANQGNTDMPGTLDSSTYGPFCKEFGTFDANSTVYFGFLVTNVPIDDWNYGTSPYGRLYNGNFRNTEFKWYF